MKLGDATISVFISELGQYRVNVNHASLEGGSVVWHTWTGKITISDTHDTPEAALKALLAIVGEVFPE